MKRTLLVILLILSFCAVQAKKVEVQLAQKVGLAYFYEHAGQFIPLDYKTLGVTATFTEMNENIAIYHIINIGKSGYVIVSADDIAIPVIGYSYESNLEPSKMPEALKYWLGMIKKEISYAIERKVSSSPEISNQWTYYLSRNSENLSIKSDKAVEPLLSSTWNQDKFYNQFCPLATGGPDGRAYAGCVATAMGQVMYYYRYPLQGVGSHGGINFGATTYQWDNMLDDLNNYNEAVATLLYHCGKAVDMSYAADGSGANTPDCVDALEDYYKYNTACSYESKYGYSDVNWANMLKDNLDAKHPMIYSGTDFASGGHAWNCDGYDASNNFHMNWGWSGYANGFFSLSDLTAGGSTFSEFQGVVQDIYPLTSGGYPYNCSGTKSISFVTGTIEDGSGPANDYTNNKDCQWLIDPDEAVSKIKLNFVTFNTEATNDVVTVYDGNSTSATVLGTFSGNTLPALVTSSGQQMLVRFQTNGSVVGQGWKATYSSVYPTYCNSITNISDNSGTIEDGSGAYSYTYNHFCRWSIAPPNATYITINFTEFNLATNDFVKLYNQENSAELANYTGTSIPAEQTYNTSKIMVMFKSDGYINSEGFSLDYTSDGSSGIDKNKEPYKLSIYPNPSISELNVSFEITDTKNITIELSSIIGQVLYSETLNNFSGIYTKKINTGNYSQGIYMLRIFGEKYNTFKKIIIQ